MKYVEDKHNVLLTVAVSDVRKDCNDVVRLTPHSVAFRAVVNSTEFSFGLQLFDEIDVDACQVKEY